MPYNKSFIFAIDDGSLDTDLFLQTVRTRARRLGIVCYNTEYLSAMNSYKISFISNSQEDILRFLSYIEMQFSEIRVSACY